MGFQLAWSAEVPETAAWKWMALVLNGLSYAVMSHVIIAAYRTEGLSAALRLTIRTNRRSAIGALRHSRLAAQNSVIATARDVFNLTMHSVPPHKPNHKCANQR